MTSAWAAILAAAAAPTHRLEAALREPRRAQEALLQCIVRENAATAFGLAHGFDGIADADGFRARVPVRNYAAHHPWIERMAGGEPSVLTTAPVIAFEETGGSSSGGKLIPYTAAGLAAFRSAVLPWLYDLARRRPRLIGGSAYVTISPATRPERSTPGGIPIGLASDAAYLGEDLVQPFLELLAVPASVAAIASVATWRRATLLHLLERSDLTFVSVWSPTFLLDLIAHIQADAEAIADGLTPGARQRLRHATRGQELDTTCLWPRLDTISCWTDGASAGHARRLGLRCPQAHISAKGLLATEAAITLPWGSGPGAVPALTSTFTEFIDARGQSRLADELQTGESYSIVVTTRSGLYRYDMGDQVRCIELRHGVPRLEFVGRSGLVSDMVGEKLDEAFVTDALACLPVAATLQPRQAPRPHYVLLVDGAAPGDAWSSLVDQRLMANPQYAYARRIGQLGPVTTLASPGFNARRAEALALSGRRLGDVKPLSITRRDD